MVCLDAVEHIAHAGGATFHGEEIELLAATWGEVAEFLRQIGAYGHFGVFEDAWWSGVLVADYAFGPFIGESVGVGAEFFHHVVPGFAEEYRSGTVGIGGEEFGEPLGAACPGGDSCDAGFFVAHPFALIDAERAEQEECFASIGFYPVGVAASGVEECGRRCSGVFFGHELVLYLEGAKLFEPFFVFAAQRILRSFHYE